MYWYCEVLKKYSVFEGRAGRKEYWSFFILNFIIGMMFIYLDLIAGTFSHSSGIGIFGGLYSISVLIPSLAVSVRRLHDTGRNGIWLLIWFVPVIGFIILLIFMLQGSQEGENKYGENPKVNIE